jgi:hypothetical protein
MRIVITEQQYKRLTESYVTFPVDEDISLEVWEDNNKLELSSIVIPKHLRGQGKGTEIMNMVINYADKVNKPLYLTPDTNFGGTSINRLKRFYKRFGFTKNDNYEVKHSMVRYPIETKQMDIEEEYPTNWNIDEFKNLKSFNQRIQYCEKNLQRISSGSSRIVYKIDDTKVLKLAKNKKGLSQNETEIMYSEDYMMGDIVAQIFDYDENNLWLEMELARKVTPQLFQNIVGISFENYVDGVNYQDSNLRPRKQLYKPKEPENMGDMWENDFVSRIFDLMGSYDNFVSGDLTKLSTYGVVKRDGVDSIVLIDYGLTDEVYNTYYKR